MALAQSSHSVCQQSSSTVFLGADMHTEHSAPSPDWLASSVGSLLGALAVGVGVLAPAAGDALEPPPAETGAGAGAEAAGVIRLAVSAGGALAAVQEEDEEEEDEEEAEGLAAPAAGLDAADPGRPDAGPAADAPALALALADAGSSLTRPTACRMAERIPPPPEDAAGDGFAPAPPTLLLTPLPPPPAAAPPTAAALRLASSMPANCSLVSLAASILRPRAVMSF